MKKLMYKPLGLGASVVGGLVASALFRRMWKLVAREEEPPQATDPRRSWKEVLAAAAMQGAVFGLVKAAVDRGGAVTMEHATGTRPS